ncbi:MAG: aminotransferase class IV [Dehalococcoidia bacterium]
MTGYAWIDGAVVPRDEARISIDDFAVRYGAACFETMLARGGRVFRVEAHLDRLEAGLRGMGVAPPPRASTVAAIEETLRANGLPDASVRLTVTAGSGRSPDLRAARAPCVIVTADPPPARPAPPRLQVATARIDARRPLAGAKSGQFLTYLLARAEVRDAGADDALLLNHDGAVVEAAAANIFILRDGGLETPPIADGPLPGITRAALIEVARSLGVPVMERTLRVPDLARAAAILLTSSIAGIVPAASLVAAPGVSGAAGLDWRAPMAPPSLIGRLIAGYEALL